MEGSAGSEMDRDVRANLRAVYIEDGQVVTDDFTYNPARGYHGCATCFNLQSYYRDGRRRCMKHDGLTSFGETQAVMDGRYA